MNGELVTIAKALGKALLMWLSTALILIIAFGISVSIEGKRVKNLPERRIQIITTTISLAAIFVGLLTFIFSL